MSYERIIAHPSRSEAISLTGNGVLTRWALGAKPRRLAEVVTEYERIWMDLAVSHTGEHFYLVNKTDRVERRRWNDLEVVGQIACPVGSEPHRVAVSPDGSLIAISGFGVGDYLLDAQTGQIETVLSGEPGLYIRFSPDGRWLACAENGQNGGTLYLYEREANAQIRGRYALKAFEPTTYSLVNPVFSPDSQWIAVYENYDFTVSEDPSGWFGHILLFAVEAGEGLWMSALESPNLSDKIAERSELERLLDPTNPFFGDAEIVCGMPTGKLAFFSTATGELTREISVSSRTPITFIAPDSALQAIWVVQDNGQVKSVSVERSLETVPLPPAPLPSLSLELEIGGHERSVRDIAYSLDGTCLFSISADETVRGWDTVSGREIFTRNLGMEPASVAVSRDGAHFVVAGKKLIVFDARTGQETLRIDAPPMSFKHAEFSPDGQFLFCNMVDRVPVVLEVKTGKPIFALRRRSVRNFANQDAMHMQSIRPERKSFEAARLAEIPPDERSYREFQAVTHTPDGLSLVVVTDEQRVEFWTPPAGPQTSHFLESETDIEAVIFSPDGRRCLTCGAKPRLWDVLSGQLQVEYQHAHPTIFSPDGNRVASADDSVFGAKIWDALTGEELHRMTGHSDSVSCVAFAPDGKHFATGSWDRTIKIWCIPS